jgi:hypothetical protein
MEKYSQIAKRGRDFGSAWGIMDGDSRFKGNGVMADEGMGVWVKG